MLITANSVVLEMVSLGIIRLDLAFFSYVLKWHQMNSVSDLTMQCLSPLPHYTFRVAEVLLQMVTVTCLFRVLQNRGNSPSRGGQLLCRICCTPVALARQEDLQCAHGCGLLAACCSQHEASVATCCSESLGTPSLLSLHQWCWGHEAVSGDSLSISAQRRTSSI